MSNNVKKSNVWVITILSVLMFLTMSIVATPLPTLEKKMIVDSENPFPRRIYVYDIAVESNGDVHIVYQKPNINDTNTTTLHYLHRSSNSWSDQILTTQVLHLSSSTQILLDDNNVIHISYIKANTKPIGKLYYRKIENNVIEPEILVREGAWHSRMQLDNTGRAMFICESEDWRQNDPRDSKLILVTTTDGQVWHEEYTDIPSVNRFRIFEFVYENGIYHVTYGDTDITKPVIGRGDQIFHRLYYASSKNGLQWTSSLIDGSQTLCNIELWTTLIVDNNKPIIGWYKYAEYGGVYNTGTSGWMATKEGNVWITNNITPASYPATREGMGVRFTLIGPGDYLAGWDFSPDNTHDDDFRGARGNIALARSASSGARNGKWQVDEFSAEGEVRLRVMNNSIYVLVLGDYIDAKLYFYEYDIGVVDLPPLCASGERVKQGTNICISGTELPFGGPFLVDYDGYIQGSDVHDPNAQPTPISKFLEGMSQ